MRSRAANVALRRVVAPCGPRSIAARPAAAALGAPRLHVCRSSFSTAPRASIRLDEEDILSTPVGELNKATIDKAIRSFKERCRNTKDVSTSDHILRRLIDECTSDSDGLGPSYAAEVVGSELLHGVLQCYRSLSSDTAEFSRRNRANPNMSYAQKAEDLLNYAEEASSKLGGVNMLTPGTDTYGIVVEAYAKVGDAAKAEELFQRIEPKWLNETPSPDAKNDRFRPTSKLYTSILNAWAFSRQPNSARVAESILEKMSHLQRLGHSLELRTIHYNLVINALAKSGEPGAAARAEQIIDHMMRESTVEPSSPGAGVAPDSRSFNTCLHAYANSDEPNAAAKAEALLNRMEDLHQKGLTKGCAPNRISYNNVITAWSRSGAKGAASRAEAILEHMQKISEMDESRETSPNEISFNGVMAAWGFSKEKGAAARCQSLLAHMSKLCREGNKEVCPDTVSYSTTIHALAVSRERNAAERAMALLESMERLFQEGTKRVKPNTVCYTAVLNAIAKSRDPDKATKAEKLLHRMENDGNASIKPNLFTYSTVIDCYAKSPEKGTAKKARELLNEMIRRAQGGEPELAPSINSYTAVLDAYTREGLMEDAERFLQDMEERGPKPTRVTYNVLITAHGRSKHPLAGVKAEEYLNRMKDKKGIYAPDRISYSSCIDAYTKSNAPGAYDNARQLFDSMLELDSSGVPNINPNKVRRLGSEYVVIKVLSEIFVFLNPSLPFLIHFFHLNHYQVTYGSLINALSRSSHPNKVEEAKRLYTEMKEKGHEPDIITANAVLRCCSVLQENCPEAVRRTTLQVAMEMFEQISKKIQPSHHTYLLFLVVCQKASTGKEYEQLVEMTFKLCIANGLLDRRTFRFINFTLPKPLLRRLFGRGGRVSFKDLPKEWSKNI